MNKKFLPFLFIAVIVGVAGFQFNSSEQRQNMAATSAKKSSLKTSSTALWRAAPPQSQSADAVDPLADKIEVAHIQAQSAQLAQLAEGQRVSFFIPQNQKEYQGVVESHYRQFDGKVSVSKGRLDAGDELTSFMVTKGPDTTLVMVATDDGVYQIEIDNQSGLGTVIDDRALDYFRKHDDSILTPPEGLS